MRRTHTELLCCVSFITIMCVTLNQPSPVSDEKSESERHRHTKPLKIFLFTTKQLNTIFNITFSPPKLQLKEKCYTWNKSVKPKQTQNAFKSKTAINSTKWKKRQPAKADQIRFNGRSSIKSEVNQGKHYKSKQNSVTRNYSLCLQTAAPNGKLEIKHFMDHKSPSHLQDQNQSIH